jgi:hypothetical protein
MGSVRPGLGGNEEIKLAALTAAFRSINPADEYEAMIAKKMVVTHEAVMERHRQAALATTLAVAEANLRLAAKLSTAFVQLSEALDRHRGKGHQKVVVEHVQVHAGGQAIVGHVDTSGGGVRKNSEGQPHALGNSSGASLRSSHEAGVDMPGSSDAERPMSDARRHGNGSTEG